MPLSEPDLSEPELHNVMALAPTKRCGSGSATLPLTFALKRTTDPWTARQQRQLAYLAEFSVQLCHVKGTNNVVADALSRPPAAGETGAGLSVAETCPYLLSVNRPGPQSSFLPLCSLQQL
jgi:hypothetical protein